MLDSCTCSRHPEEVLNDWYPTPEWVTEALFDTMPPDESLPVLDPCAGDGAILQVAKRRGRDVSAIEIRSGAQPRLTTLCGDVNVTIGDWLQISQAAGIRHSTAIVTNPPFGNPRKGIDLEIAKACLDARVPYCALLLLTTRKNRAAWAGFWKQYPPTGEVPLTTRPVFVGFGTGMTDVSWFIWDASKIPATIRPRGKHDVASIAIGKTAGSV
jgi:predicted RNA methylase